MFQRKEIWLETLLVIAGVSCVISAPIDDCKGDVECMYNKLPVLKLKAPPCKRMLSRHGRSVECVEEEDTSPAVSDLSTTPSINYQQKVFLKNQINDILKQRELVAPLQESELRDSIIFPDDDNDVQTRNQASEDGSELVSTQSGKQRSLVNLGTQIKELQAKVAKLKESHNRYKTKTEDSTEVPATPANPGVSQEIQKKLQRIEDDIDAILPLLPADTEPDVNRQQLEELSQRLSEEEARRANRKQTTLNPKTTSTTTTTTTTSSTTAATSKIQKSTSTSTNTDTSPPTVESMNSRLNKLSELVNDLVNINKLSYTNLKQEIDDLKQSRADTSKSMK